MVLTKFSGTYGIDAKDLRFGGIWQERGTNVPRPVGDSARLL
jgi:hypothetical protein